MSVPGVYARVMDPAMNWVGRMWETNCVGVADEHLATAICQQVMASLYGVLLDHARPKSGVRVMLAGVEDQHHLVGLRMIGDVLEGDGYDVIFLGPSVPNSALAGAVRRHRPQVVGFSVTMPGGGRALERAIAEVQSVDPEVSILLGGRGVPRALRDQGYAYATNAETVLDAVRGATGRATPLMSPSESGAATPERDGDAPGALTGREGQLAKAADHGAETARMHARRAAAYRRLAMEDPVTGLPNRRAFDDRFAELAAATGEAPLTVTALDLDGFKQINDTYGHDVGDRVLREVGDAVRRAIRPNDFVARVGGDEFMILLPDTDTKVGADVAERVRRALEARTGEPAIRTSIGVAGFAGDLRHAALQADQALYAAKDEGRNSVCAAKA